MPRIRERMTYANVMATIAVFGVLGGGAYAASELDKNEVKSKHIKAGAVKNADLADNAVTAPKVANGSLRSEDFAAGQLPQGPAGEQGPQGIQGIPGATGPAGSAVAFAHVNADKTIDTANSKDIVAQGPVFTAGTYCFNIVAADAPKNVVATLELAGGGAATDQIWATLTPGVVATNCGGLPNADLLVGVTNSAGTGVNRPFYIAVN